MPIHYHTTPVYELGPAFVLTTCSRASALKLLKETIEARSERGTVKRFLKSLDDTSAVENVIRYIAALVEQFQVRTPHRNRPRRN